MAVDRGAQELKRQFDLAKMNRSMFHADWEDIVDLIRPVSASFVNSDYSAPTPRKNDKIYDSTAPDSLADLAGGLMAFLSNPSTPWFNLSVRGYGDLRNDRDAKIWLSDITQIIHDEYARDSSNTYAALHETYLDIGAFGTGIIHQTYDDELDSLVFRAWPLAVTYLKENSQGRIDTVYIERYFTVRQLIQEFGVENIDEQVLKKDHEDKVKIIHCLYPSTDKMKFMSLEGGGHHSVWLDYDNSRIMKTGTFSSLPYHIGRWSKLAGEIYGRGPGVNALPDVRMLNRMEYTMIQASQKASDPPITVPFEGFLLPIKTGPGSVNYREPGIEDEIQAVPFEGNLAIGFEHAEQKRNSIKKQFFADLFQLGKEKIEMTAFEASERREEKLRQISPITGRLISELLTTLVTRSVNLLFMKGRLPEPPGSLQGKIMKVDYTSPAAKAQEGIEGMNISRLFQDLTPFAQVRPEILDVLDVDELAAVYAQVRGVNPKIIRTREQVAQIRNDRAQQEQMAAAAGAAQPVASAIKDLSLANQAGNLF